MSPYILHRLSHLHQREQSDLLRIYRHRHQHFAHCLNHYHLRYLVHLFRLLLCFELIPRHRHLIHLSMVQ
jgi:hypothetical protein